MTSATAHAHYENEATYNIGSSFKGRPHFNILKIHPRIGTGGESSLITIKDWDLLHQRQFVLVLQSYCALQELLLKMKFTLAVAPPFLYTMASPSAMPTQSVQQYGFFSEHARWKQVVKGNFKIIVSLSFLVA